MLFRAIPYVMTPRCQKYTYDQRDLHDKAGFTIRDVEIIECLVKMMVASLNYAETVDLDFESPGTSYLSAIRN